MPVATYDTFRDRWAFLHDSYRGGTYYRAPSSTRIGSVTLSWNPPATTGDAINTSGQPIRRGRRSYLVPHSEEDDTSFDSRHSLAAHIPIVAPIVKTYAEAVTNNVQRTTTGVPDAVIRDVNRRGQSWETAVDEWARWLALFGLGFVVCDAPALTDARSRADELALGVRPYACFVMPAAVALLESNEWGEITRFVYADEPYYPRDVRGGTASYDVSLREWSLDAHEGTPGWRRLHGTLRIGGDDTPSIATQIRAFAQSESGPLPPQLGGKLPVVDGYYEPDTSSATPQGIPLVDDVADIERLVYNLLSWCNEIQRAAGFPFLALPQGSTGGHMDPRAAVTIGPARALPYDSSTGQPVWVQPDSKSTEELRTHCGFLFQLALRSAGLEVAADTSAQVQSGEALRIRSRDFDARCARFAGQMASLERRVLRMLAMLAGSGDPGDALVVEYAKRFVLPDPSEDLARAVTLLGMRSSTDLGDEATVEAIRQALIAALPALSPDRVEEIMADVRTRYASQTEYQSRALAREETMQEAQTDAAKPKPIVPADADSELPEIYAYHIEMGIVTVNEVRERLGFPPIQTGNTIATIATTKAEEAAGVVPTVSEGETPAPTV